MVMDMVYQLYLMLVNLHVNLVQNKFQSRVIRVMLHGLRTAKISSKSKIASMNSWNSSSYCVIVY